MVDVPGDGGVGRGVRIGGNVEFGSEFSGEFMIESGDYAVLQAVGKREGALEQGLVLWRNAGDDLYESGVGLGGVVRIGDG